MLLISSNCVKSLELCVADNANNTHVVEGKKRICPVAFFVEHLLARMAPSLQIVWVVGILNEAEWGI